MCKVDVDEVEGSFYEIHVSYIKIIKLAHRVTT